jgi:hypothetical protein
MQLSLSLFPQPLESHGRVVAPELPWAARRDVEPWDTR